MSWPIAAIHQEKGLPAIAIIIEKRATGAKRFRKQLSSIRTVVVVKLDASLSRHIY